MMTNHDDKASTTHTARTLALFGLLFVLGAGILVTLVAAVRTRRADCQHGFQCRHDLRNAIGPIKSTP
jgi:hypothetical protein